MTDHTAEIARVLAERDGVDPTGDKAAVVRALLARFPGVTTEQIVRAWAIAVEITTADAAEAPTSTLQQIFFGEPVLAWRCGEPDRLWFGATERAYRVRPALDSEVWALSTQRDAEMPALAVIRARDGAVVVCATREPDAWLELSDAQIGATFDAIIDEAIETTARGPG